MRAGFALWNERVSPVFDVSCNIVLVDIEEGKIVNQRRAALPDDYVRKIKMLQKLGIETLVCGAISQDLSTMISNCGIKIIAFVAGDMEAIIHAFLKNDLPNPLLTMPGCRKHGRYRNRCSEGKQRRKRRSK
jgi:predicted Fe-Mo cluster-binding NifX family protein